jgi:hypothetical protein
MAPFNVAQDPAAGQLIDPVLTNLARAYRPIGFVYDQLVTSFPVQTISGQYPVFDESFFGYGDDDGGAVDDRAPTPEIDFRYSTEHYRTKNYRRKVTISEEERTNAHPAMRLEYAKTQRLLTELAALRERRLAAVLRGVDNGGQFTLRSATPSTKWDNYSGAGPDIRGDIKSAQLAVYGGIGMWTNTITMTYPVAYAMALAPQIVDIIKYTVNGLQVLELGDRVLPATLFGHRVVIARGALTNVAGQGLAKSLREIWGDNVRLTYVNDQPAWGMPSTVYGFRSPIGPMGQETQDAQVPGGVTPASFALVQRWWQQDPPVENIRAWERIDERVVAPDLGFEIADTLT